MRFKMPFLKFLFKLTPKFIRDIFREYYNKHSGILKVHETGTKKLLLSYIKSPFYRDGSNINHPNYFESIDISDVLKKYNISLDVVDYRYEGNVNFSEYDYILGFGLPFQKSFQGKNLLTKICYHAGPNIHHTNLIEAKRVNQFNKKNHIFLSPERETYWPWIFSTISSDALMHTGNSWTRSTYAEFEQNLFTLPVMSIMDTDHDPLTFNDSARDFIWIGGNGAIWKGLDLVIEAFKKLKTDSKLHIFGPVENEPGFYNFYKNYFDNNDSIYFHGMVDVNSDHFKEIIKGCAFTVFPGSSEGGASSVLTSMHLGLIPIVTIQSSIDLDNFGILIEELQVNSTKLAMEKAQMLDKKEISRQRNAVIKHIKKNHTITNYRNSFEESLKQIINL